jgi:hypothetical protein
VIGKSTVKISGNPKQLQGSVADSAEFDEGWYERAGSLPPLDEMNPDTPSFEKKWSSVKFRRHFQKLEEANQVAYQNKNFKLWEEVNAAKHGMRITVAMATVHAIRKVIKRVFLLWFSLFFFWRETEV